MNTDMNSELTKGISQYLGKPFAIKSYTEEGDCYKVHGTIPRYRKRANVEVLVKKAEMQPHYWHISDDTITMSGKTLGSVELGKDVVVSDPCYNRDVWCMTQLHNVRAGTWMVDVSIDAIDSWGTRLYVLELYHSDYGSMVKARPKWQELFSLGVDSGTMSVIDDAYYRRKNGSISEFEADEGFAQAFMDKCFKATDDYAGFLVRDGKNVGVICSSGIGDGSYPLSGVINNGELIALRISFM